MTLLETIQLTFTLLPILLTLPRHILTTFYSRHDFTIPGLKRALLIAQARSSHLLTLSQSRALIPSTADAIAHYARARQIPHSRTVLPSPAVPGILHLVGAQQPGRALLYLHGGGYVYPLQPFHLNFALRLSHAAKAQLVLLEYALAPESPYPAQLIQTAQALNHLLAAHTPDDIILAGDSAGANLALGLLAHVIQSKEGVPHVSLPPGQKLAGLLAVSPRTCTDTRAESFQRNAHKDIVSVQSTEFFAAQWAPVKEVWASPVLAAPSFWAAAPVGRVLLLAGGDEVYVDDIRAFAGRFGAEEGVDDGAGTRALVVCPGEYHDQGILDLGVGIEETRMLQVAVAWTSTI